MGDGTRRVRPRFFSAIASGLVLGVLPVIVALPRAGAQAPGDPFEWTDQFGTPDTEVLLGVAVDAVGGAAASGYTMGTFLGHLPEPGQDAWVRRYAPDGTALWTRQFGLPFGLTQAWDAAVDATGNVYVAGLTTGTLPNQSSSGSADAYLRKYNPAGVEVWTRQFGTFSDDAAYSVALDPAGNPVVGGVISDQPDSVSANAYVAKFDAAGSVLWSRVFDVAAADDAVSAVAVDPTGQIAAVGSAVTAGSGLNAFVRRYDGAGNQLWGDQFGTGADDSAQGVGVDGAGNTYVALSTTGALGGPASGGKDAAVRRYQGSAPSWTVQFGTVGDDEARGVAVDPAGDVYVSGYASNALPGQNHSGSADAFARKYTSGGAEAWTRQLGTFGVDSATDVAVTGGGDVVAGGFVSGALPGEQSAGGVDAFVRKGWRFDADGDCLSDVEERGTYGTDPANPDSDGDGVFDGEEGTLSDVLGARVSPPARALCVAQYRSAHPPTGVNELVETAQQEAQARIDRFLAPPGWVRQFGTPALDGGSGAAADASGNVLLAGFAESSLDGQPWAGSHDAVVRKYTAAGALLWSRQFGTGGSDVANTVAAHPQDGSVVVVGYVSGALPGQTWSGGPDAFVRKYDASGNVSWTRQFGTPDSDAAYGVVVNGAGEVYVAGVQSDRPGVFTADGFVRKFSAGGTQLWAHVIASPDNDAAWDVDVDQAGNAVVSGSTWGVVGGGSLGSEDGFVRKLTPAGGVVWTRQFGSVGRDGASGIGVLGNGDVVVGGWFNAANARTAFPDLADAFVATLRGSDGGDGWARFLVTPGTDVTNDVTVDALGEVYATGFVGGALPGHDHAGALDGFGAKYDAGGTLLWTGQFGTPQDDQVLGAAPEGAGDLYGAGMTWGTLPGQATAGSLDGFLARLFIDVDGDCLSDSEERRTYGTDPRDPDSGGVPVVRDGVEGSVRDLTTTYPPPKHRVECEVRATVQPVLDQVEEVFPLP